MILKLRRKTSLTPVSVNFDNALFWETPQGGDDDGPVVQTGTQIVFNNRQITVKESKADVDNLLGL